MTVKFEVWSEGYATTGMSNTAHLHGTFEAKTFKEACDIALKDNPDYNGKTLWGCGLYDNEKDARKGFG